MKDRKWGNTWSFFLAVFLCLFISSCEEMGVLQKPIDEQMLIQYGWRGDITEDVLVYDKNDPEISYDRSYWTLYFLGDGRGLIKEFVHSEDTYFGTTNRETPLGLTYKISGPDVIINDVEGLESIFADYTLRWDGDNLVHGKDFKYKKETISNTNREWIESNKYYVLPDDERLGFQFFIICEKEDGFPTTIEGNYTSYFVCLAIGVRADQHAYEKGIGSIAATYTISGGNFLVEGKTKSSLTLETLTKPNDECIIDDLILVRIPTNKTATIAISIKTYDRKRKEYKTQQFAETYDFSGNQSSTNGNKSGKTPEAVDLGLSVKWASWNLGASAPEEYGNYYAMGETSPKSSYTLENHKWYSGLDTEHHQFVYSKYGDGAILDLEDDAAYVNLGGKWRTPTKKEFDELRKNCSEEPAIINGEKVLKFTSKIPGYTNKWIYFPQAGLFDAWMRSEFYDDRGAYLISGTPFCVFGIADVNSFYFEGILPSDGVSVRPVEDK